MLKFNQGRNPYASPYIAGGFRPGKEYFRKIIADWGFVSCGKIADICSGYARWSVFLAEVNEFVCGFERNLDAITLSRRLCEYLALDNVSFEVADVTQLISTPDGAFDGAWCFNAMQFVERDKALSEIYRILKPGGRLFVGVYNGAGRVLEKFFEGYRAGGLAHPKTRFALRGLKGGAMYNGKGNFASADVIEKVLRQFGFTPSPDREIEVQMKPRAAPTTLFTDEVRDLQSLAVRLESDAAFASKFAAHPEVAYRYPINLHFSAIKV